MPEINVGRRDPLLLLRNFIVHLRFFSFEVRESISRSLLNIANWTQQQEATWVAMTRPSASDGAASLFPSLVGLANLSLDDTPSPAPSQLLLQVDFVDRR